MKKRYAIPVNIARLAGMAGSILMSLIFALLVANGLGAQITVEKQIASVSPASSGVTGHIDVKYEITLTNTSGAAVNNGSLGDELDNPSNLGNAFVGVTGALPVTIVTSSGAAVAVVNNNFDGLIAGDASMASNIDMPNNSSITFAFTAELNPTAAGVPAGDLNNTAVYLTGAAVAINSNAATLPDCWTNCVMACNTLVNISANSNCEVEVLSQAVLEGEDETCAAMGFYTVSITDKNGDPVPSPIGKAYIGQKLTATVTNIACGNSCWGKVLIEDKRAPELICGDTAVRCNQIIDPTNLGFPVPVADILNPNGPQPYIASGIDACGNVQLTYQDSVVDLGCADTTTVIYRKWKATDASGLMAMCFDTIYLKSGTLADIDLPPHYDGISVNPDGDPAEPILPACGGTWTKFANGFPDTSATGTGAPKGILCGKIQFFFEDDTIEICGEGYKLLRNWIIVDWCHPQDRLEYIQRIKIADLDPPVLSCPGTRFVAADTVSTGAWSCAGEYVLPVPQNIESLPAPDPHGVYVIGECSAWTYEVAHLAATSPDDCTPDAGAVPTKDNIVRIGTTADGRPIFKAVNLPLGCNWIYYTVTDDCGHVTKCAYDIFVRDDVKPTVACDKHTVVSLTDDVPGGVIQVPASVFDDGSFDNCALDTMLVRRTSDNCGIRGNTRFKGYTEFCCADINHEVEVILKVFDKAGNMSQCTVKVTVQDKLPPIITSCPKDTTVDCGVSLKGDLNKRFGTPTWKDNCGATVSDSLIGRVNNCGLGTYTRIFTVKDKGGLKTTCFQRIHVVNRHPVTRKDIKFPHDTSLVNVCQGDLSPDKLGKPIYPPFDQCTQLAASYEDRTFSFVDGACLKILRVWSVLNWCTKEEWDTVQVIMVTNTIKPTIIGCNTKYFDIKDSTCTKDITLSVTGKDDCTPVNKLKWSYTFKRNDGTKYTGYRNSANFSKVPKGTHTMTWRLEDQCGNVTTCVQRVIVRDRKRPTPYCRTGIVTVLMQGSKEIAIWANDFNIGSFDNCTAQSNLRFSFSADTTDKGKTFTCADLGPGGADSLHTVQMWVTDEAGNQDYCTVKVLLQDNSGVCSSTLNTKGTIAGRVMTVKHEMVEDAEVALTNASLDLIQKKMSGADGSFTFKAPMEQGYTIKVQKSGPYDRGVSTRDLVKIQKHLLGLDVFDQPYQYIAADANNSHSVSTSDIVEIRKLILGKIKQYKRSPSWRFVDAHHQYEDPFSPWPIKEDISISKMTKDMMANDFMAVKIGDLSGDAGFNLNGDNSPRELKKLDLYTDVSSIDGGQTIEMPINCATQVQLEGMQMTIQLPDGVRFDGLESGALHLDVQNLGLQFLSKGIITLSWSKVGGQSVQADAPLFYLKLTSNQATDFNTLSIGSSITALEAFDTDGNDYVITWRVKGGTVDEGDFKLLQNTPNPFNNTTTIGFILPESSRASLTVFDMSGKVIHKVEQNFEAGYNEIVFDMNNAGVTGVLYYKLETATHSATRKMVVLK